MAMKADSGVKRLHAVNLFKKFSRNSKKKIKIPRSRYDSLALFQ